jgi:SHS2 domain-containing protein
VGRYALLEAIAVADCALEIEAEDLDDLFATAAVALADVMVDPATVRRSVERTISLEAGSLDLLLFDWLGELIALKDSEQVVFTEAHVRVVPERPCRLVARLAGGRIEAGRTEPRADVKAVTLHEFSVTPTDGGWRARLVLDV